MDKEEITAVYRNHFGEIISFHTSRGRIISYQKAILDVQDEKIGGVNIVEANDGSVSLTSHDYDDFNQLPSYY